MFLVRTTASYGRECTVTLIPMSGSCCGRKSPTMSMALAIAFNCDTTNRNTLCGLVQHHNYRFDNATYKGVPKESGKRE